MATRALVAEDFGVDREGVAVGRVEGEVGAVEVDPDGAEAEGDATEDLGSGLPTVETWAVSGLTLRPSRTTTLPRS